MNGYRYTVAHHQLAISDGKIVFYSAQLRKIFKRVKDGKPLPAKSVTEIAEWVTAARQTYTRGENVLENFRRLVELAKHRGLGHLKSGRHG